MAVSAWQGDDTGPPAGPPPGAIAHRTLASALGALVAAGAKPAWFTLALTLPRGDVAWIEAFRDGLQSLAELAGVQLVGGDMTAGAFAVTIHAHGLLPRGESVPPAGARPGDLIYVTGTLGDAGLALLALQGEVRLPARDLRAAEQRLSHPEPRLACAPALRGVASAAVSLVEEGLVAGLERLLRASGTGATVHTHQLPLSDTLRRELARAGGWVLPLTAPGGGEVCFTVPARLQDRAEREVGAAAGGVTWIGTVDRAPGLRCVLEDGTELGSWG